MQKTLDELFCGIFLLELAQINEVDLIEPQKELRINEKDLGRMNDLEKRIFTLTEIIGVDIDHINKTIKERWGDRDPIRLPCKDEERLIVKVEKLRDRIKVLNHLMLMSIESRFGIGTFGNTFLVRKGFRVAKEC